MTNEKSVLNISNHDSYIEEMNQLREVMRSVAIEQGKDEFLTGFVLLNHPMTQIEIATPSGQGLANCILFSDENTEQQIVIQLNSINSVINYLIPLFIAADLFEKSIKNGELNCSPFEVGLIDKLLEMKQRLIEKEALAPELSEAVTYD